ncbi:MAG: diaminopimelate epimerase [Actinobacteria bacterium]|nr:MAG: diaminopimelate epimerase [Actinomycetota bacterium]
MELRFTKMHGLGNDFVVVDDTDAAIDLTPDAVAWLCDRNFGIGADGLILVRPPHGSDAEFSWGFFNADGSVAEMCGNGIRCLAKYVVDRGMVPSDADTLRVETAGGVRRIALTRDAEGALEFATVDMGEPVLAPADVPTTLPGDRVVGVPLPTDLGEVHVTCVSMGNPHTVIWVDDVDTAPVETLGPLIENDPAFPNRTNVEFARAFDDGCIELRVWERGVGETLACGTGACATLVAAVLGERIAGRAATVQVPGGELAIRWSEEDGRVYLTGPAAEVFTGLVQVADEDG